MCTNFHANTVLGPPRGRSHRTTLLPTICRAMRSRRQSIRKAFNFGAYATKSDTDRCRVSSEVHSLPPIAADARFPSRLGRNSAGDREWATSGLSARRHLLPARCSDESLALGLLASELAGPADRVSFFPVRFFGWLLVKSSTFHLAKNAFALHFFLECSQSLVDVVVANEYLQEIFLSCSGRAK